MDDGPIQSPLPRFSLRRMILVTAGLAIAIAWWSPGYGMVGATDSTDVYPGDVVAYRGGGTLVFIQRVARSQMDSPWPTKTISFRRNATLSGLPQTGIAAFDLIVLDVSVLLGILLVSLADNVIAWFKRGLILPS